VYTLSTIAVVLCWFVYVPMFIGRGGPKAERTREVPFSKLGIVLQYGGAAIVWVWRRPFFSPLVRTSFPLQFFAPIMAVILAVGSVYFSWIALKTLGKQWSLVAGMMHSHRLVQEGPYSMVRHPLYICFFGLTVATGMVWTTPGGLFFSAVFFWLGVWIRVGSEEKILLETFGREFEAYKKHVPAFFPF
jgi:protein-S-isoprenylcysteine O-methyltransferase Ste14